MENLVGNHFHSHNDAELIYEVIEGSPLVELLRRSRDEDIDLILVGGKSKREDSGTLPEKLVRKAPCSVLILPQGREAKITKVLVPVDFSENSAEAMEVAIAFASASGVPSIDCLHVYRVPTGYHKTGKSYEAFAEIMKGHAENYFRTFVSAFDLKGVVINPIFESANNPAKAIKKVVQDRGADLLVMGALGRSAAAAVLLGSVTERTIRTTDVPLIAVKKKGTGMSLLDVLLKETVLKT